MRISERMEAARKLQELDLEWKHTARLGLKLSLFGDQLSFTNDGDFVSIVEAQEAVIYLANQLGLEVKGHGKTKKN